MSGQIYCMLYDTLRFYFSCTEQLCQVSEFTLCLIGGFVWSLCYDETMCSRILGSELWIRSLSSIEHLRVSVIGKNKSETENFQKSHNKHHIYSFTAAHRLVHPRTENNVLKCTTRECSYNRDKGAPPLWKLVESEVWGATNTANHVPANNHNLKDILHDLGGFVSWIDHSGGM